WGSGARSALNGVTTGASTPRTLWVMVSVFQFQDIKRQTSDIKSANGRIRGGEHRRVCGLQFFLLPCVILPSSFLLSPLKNRLSIGKVSVTVAPHNVVW